MRKVIWFLCFLFMLSATAQADFIYFRNGKVIEGTIIRQTDIYIRLQPQYGLVEREFLLENIVRIVKDGEITYRREVIEELDDEKLDTLPYNIRKRAEEMAVSLIEEAMRNVDLQNMRDSADVQVVAQQKANELLRNAVLSAQDATPEVKYAAAEIANALIEESVKSAVAESSGTLDEASIGVKEAARARASALIDEAIRSEEIDSLTSSSIDVKMAAKAKASELIENALKDADVSKSTIKQKKTVTEDIILTEQEDKSVDEARSALTQDDPPMREYYGTAEVQALMKEAVEKRVKESASAMEEEKIKTEQQLLAEYEQENVLVEEFKDIIIDDAEEKEIAEDQNENNADSMIQREVEKSRNMAADKDRQTATINQPEKLTVMGFLMGFNRQDYIILVLMIMLMVMLFQRRVQSRGQRSGGEDVMISSSLTYQNLPDELKGRITSSDVTNILSLQANFMNQVGLESASKENKTVIVEDSQMVEYIFEQAKKAGQNYRHDDIIKVLEVRESAMEQDHSG